MSVSSQPFAATGLSEPQMIRFEKGKLEVPDHPIIPFIEGDGTGPDIWRLEKSVLSAAVLRS